MKNLLFVVVTAFIELSTMADVAKVAVLVVDDASGKPVEGVQVTGYFTEDIGWRAWTDSSVPNKDAATADRAGRCKLSGKTNCGKVGCWVETPPTGYYCPPCGWGHQYSEKNLFGVWQPDNLVATIRLQRVEHPIPLFVKQVELRDFERGIGGFDGTNSVLRFDLVKGEWLPPYGRGEHSDMSIVSTVTLTGNEKRFLPQEGIWGDLQFYDLATKVEFGGNDWVSTCSTKKSDGIRIRVAGDSGAGRSLTRKAGKRKKIAKNKDWYCERFNDYDSNRCYTFRIRSRRDDKGKLVEAYYGKIYGDFEFEGDDKKGLIGVKFLYYLNPTSLDRNLEWDMKNNLCPTAGKHESRQP